jgi:TonB family protein
MRKCGESLVGVSAKRRHAVIIAFAAALLLTLGLGPVRASPLGCQPGPAPIPIASTHSLPPYPPLSVFAHEEGVTRLTVVLDSQGNVADDFVSQTSESRFLDEAAVKYVKENWKWQPPSGDCLHTDIEVTIDITWAIHEKPSAVASSPYIAHRLGASDYPAEAIAKKEEGITGIMILYSESGQFLTANIIDSSGHSDLDDAALTIAVQRYRLTSPATLAGRPVKSGAYYAMEWKLPPPKDGVVVKAGSPLN